MAFPYIVDIDAEHALFIIGNGFDLYHGVPSKYTDFRQWLISNKHQYIVDSLELFFPTIKDGGVLLWQDFEEALGNYDQKQIAKTLSEGYDRMMDESIQSLAQEWFCPLIRQVKLLMKNWARSIDITHVANKLPLPQDCLYITFNYTKLLELVYNIFYDNIFHIHGSIDSTIFIGHRTYKNKGNEVDDVFYHEQVREDIINIMNSQNKDLLRFFDNNPNLVRRLHTIKEVFVLGHSLSEIDRTYFDSIRTMVYDDALWHFSVHNDKDEMRVSSLISHFRIQKHTVNYSTFEL